MNHAQPAVSFAGVTKRYGSVTALDALDLTIPAGQKVALLGPNGAGKTTAVSLMLGLRTATGGDVRVFGGDPRDARTRTAAGAMLQTSGIPAHLSVAEALALFRTYYPAPLAADELLSLAGLTEMRRAKVTALSGGQLQRLYFAIAICGDPQLLVLDEPTNGLDVEARRALLDTVDAIAQRGRTVVLTTHYLEEADQFADRVVVIDRGSIVADAAPAEIKHLVARKCVRFVCDGREVVELTEHPERFLRELFASGAAVSDLTVTGATLEEAFIQLTSAQEKQVA